MMKKLFALAVALLSIAACSGKKDNPDDPKPVKTDITGIWELSSVTTKVSVGDENVSVYVEFASGGSFTLYQKIGEGRYTRFTGKYSFSDDKLSGTYADGSAWGPYGVVLNESTLTLTTAGGKEVDTYKKVSSIPSSVTGNLY